MRKGVRIAVVIFLLALAEPFAATGFECIPGTFVCPGQCNGYSCTGSGAAGYACREVDTSGCFGFRCTGGCP
jgi:hypothetical protein